MEKPDPEYAELHCVSNFSFLRGASHPEELVKRAAELGYRAIAITDECSVAGIVRAHTAAKEYSVQLIVGSEFYLEDGLHLILLARSRRGYAQLCGLITQARRAADKGDYSLGRKDLRPELLTECIALWVPRISDTAEDAYWLQKVFPEALWITQSRLLEAGDDTRCLHAEELAEAAGIPLVATGQVHMHRRARRALQDTLTAIRHGVTLDKAGSFLFTNGERYLRSRQYLPVLYPTALLAESCRIAGLCEFSIADLKYEYPHELVPPGMTATEYLRDRTEAGVRKRWPEGEPAKVRRLIEHELQLIAELKYEAYFLTVYDIVKFARSRDILCQGRGSAANSAVCYCLGITEVDPARMSMLMERFISKERREPPDIDVDFENQRREEVIQYIYQKYGRSRAALTATVITYRPRGAIRDAGKALGLSMLQVGQLSKAMQWWDGREINSERVKEAGFDPDTPLIRRVLTMANALLGFPRHLSQHVGGFLISEQPLHELVPVENASMPDRTVIQWDKDDLEALALLKIDVLALGMLTALHKGFDLLTQYHGRLFAMHTVPAECPDVYRMVSRGDTIGVFQIESRAQMAMLPRLKPRCFYDLVIEVAIVRPGPIQGEMVHPYLRRRNGEEPVVYPGEAVKSVLERTLGVPIFQEQVMQLAMVAAGFSAGEADQLRRSMAAWKRHGTVSRFEERLTQGMVERGYSEQFATQVFNQIKGFGEYGFPESHAASFALLAYVSAWMKCHHPAAFFCSLLNSQPMGFYAPAQLVQAAQRHDVVIRPVDVNRSDHECSLERGVSGAPELRLGFCMVKGLLQTVGERVAGVRAALTGNEFASVQDFFLRVDPDKKSLEALAAADAFASLSGNRHQAHWQASGLEESLPLWGDAAENEPEATPLLRAPTEGMNIVADYKMTGLTLRRHPLALLRERFKARRVKTAADMEELPDGAEVSVVGLVVTRQRPGSAKKVTFITLEDETGYLNVIVWQQLADTKRQVVLRSRLMGVSGQLQKADGVTHLIARELEDHSSLLGGLLSKSRDFH